MRRENFKWMGMGLVLLVTLGLAANDVAWGHRKLKTADPQQAETARKVRPRGGEEMARPGATAAEARLANWRTRRVTLPEGVVEAMEMNSFDEASGELSPALLEALGLTFAERDKLAAATSALLDAFQDVEAQVAEVREGGTTEAAGRCLVMPPCAEAALPLLEGFRTEVEGLLGKDRGATFFLLTRKELRHGGGDGMWIGYESRSGPRAVCFGEYSQGRVQAANRGTATPSLKEMRRYNRLAALLDE